MSDDDIKKAMVQTERGAGRELTLNDVQPIGVAPGQGADWFSPRQPLHPIAPPEVAGRVLDFPPGYNLQIQPRAFEEINFHALRRFSVSYDPLRLIIERRKDQVCRLPWAIRAKHDGGKRPKISALPASMRERIRDIELFFRRPDYDVTFRSWLRGLLEDLFVIDAPSLFCERDAFGSLTALRVSDGSTFKRIIDDWGRTPRPIRWSGQPFMWNGAEVNAGNYAALGFKLVGGLAYPPAFQQILKGMPAVSLTTRDLIYRPFNVRPGHLYGFSNVEAIVTTISTAMRRSFSQLEYYREGNQPEGFYSLPSLWTPDQVQKFQDYFDNLYSGHLGQRRKIRFMAGEKGSYQPLKEPPLKSEFDEWLCRICCFAFSYPATAFIHQVNRATAEQHEAQAEKEGLEPIKNWSADLFNEIIEREFNSDDVEFAWEEEQDIDPKKQADVLTAYADSGALTLNEVRERIGEEPSPDPAASVLAVKTMNGRVPISGAAKVDTTTKETADGRAFDSA